MNEMTFPTKTCIFSTFTDDLEEEITTTLPFVGPRNNVPLHDNKPLKWDHRVNLIGDKCPNPRIHICEKCERPILLYGRLIPCKHVFCYDCAKANDSQCLRCNDKVARVEKNKLGAVYMCTFENCRRTYLSHRDLQAHIQHRHLRRSSSYTTCPSQASLGAAIVSLINTTTPNPAMVTSPSTSGSAITSLTTPFAQRGKITHGTSNSTFPMCTIPVVSSTRPNLITVPIHDEAGSANAIQHSQQSKAKLSSKNPVISGKSPTFIPQTLVNLPRGNLQWPNIGSIQAPSPFTPSLQTFTPQTLEGYVNPVNTNQWNVPLISDPRQTTINRHFYQ